MNALTQFLRNVVLVLLAFAGLAMAFVFMVSTAIAIGVLYLVARLRGKPFAPAAFWQARRGNVQWQFVRTAASGASGAAATRSAPSASSTPPRRVSRTDNVTDVEARDLP